MNNGVANVNSTSTPNREEFGCNIKNLQYWEDVTHMYQVDEKGEPIYETEHTDGDFNCYVCLQCDNDFKSFEEGKEHFNV